MPGGHDPSVAANVSERRSLSTAAVAAGNAVRRWFRRDPARQAGERAYQSIVAQSRAAVFFTDLGVPDTLDGRFDLICLHGFLYLHRLKAARPRGEAVSQHFVDAMFADMDRSLREIGTGDLGVGREVNYMAQAFYGRIAVYEDGLRGDDAILQAALARNLFGTVADPARFLDAMAAYARAAAAALERQQDGELLAGNVSFQTPDRGAGS
jgi:cytochrome b pre-mRNA-processing protein 3